MSFIWRAVLVLFIFVACGLLVAKIVVAHGLAGGAPLPQVRLSGAMAGLFAGGAAATLVVLVLAFGPRSK